MPHPRPQVPQDAPIRAPRLLQRLRQQRQVREVAEHPDPLRHPPHRPPVPLQPLLPERHPFRRGTVGLPSVGPGALAPRPARRARRAEPFQVPADQPLRIVRPRDLPDTWYRPISNENSRVSRAMVDWPMLTP